MIRPNMNGGLEFEKLCKSAFKWYVCVYDFFQIFGMSLISFMFFNGVSQYIEYFDSFWKKGSLALIND